MARDHLTPGGRVIVADTSAPVGPIARRLWRGFLRTFEPATVLEVADGALEYEIEQADLELLHTERLANGRLAIWVAELGA